jgi:hypothetical protein
VVGSVGVRPSVRRGGGLGMHVVDSLVCGRMVRANVESAGDVEQVSRVMARLSSVEYSLGRLGLFASHVGVPVPFCLRLGQEAGAFGSNRRKTLLFIFCLEWLAFVRA